jgi:hypothetical protein
MKKSDATIRLQSESSFCCALEHIVTIEAMSLAATAKTAFILIQNDATAF